MREVRSSEAARAYTLKEGEKRDAGAAKQRKLIPGTEFQTEKQGGVKNGRRKTCVV